MKIVDLQAFIQMPGGTVFQKVEPQAAGALEVLELGLKADFVASPISQPEFEGANSMEGISDKWDEMEAGGSAPLAYGHASARDGLFENQQLFAVYERQDLERLIAYLSAQLARAY